MYWFVFVSSVPSPKMWLWCKCAGYLLQHGEWQFVGGTLDLVLGLQVRHPLGADPVDGWDDVALGQAAPHCLAARSYLWRGSTDKVTLGAQTRKFLRTHTNNLKKHKRLHKHMLHRFGGYLWMLGSFWGGKKENWISLFTWQFHFFSVSLHAVIYAACVCSSSVNKP